MGPAFFHLALPPPQASESCLCYIVPMVMLALQNLVWETQEEAYPGVKETSGQDSMWSVLRDTLRILKNYLLHGSFASLK